jgi:hypothetical protein
MDDATRLEGRPLYEKLKENIKFRKIISINFFLFELQKTAITRFQCQDISILLDEHHCPLEE